MPGPGPRSWWPGPRWPGGCSARSTPSPTGCAGSTSSAPAATARPPCWMRWPTPSAAPASRCAGTYPDRTRSWAAALRCWSTTPTGARSPSWPGWFELVDGPLGYLVVAHRPWPRPTGTAALGAALAGHRPPVVLDVLDRAGVAARARLRLAEPPAPGPLVELVFARTAGLPVLVDRLLDALVEQVGPDRARIPLPDRSPPGVLRPARLHGGRPGAGRAGAAAGARPGGSGGGRGAGAAARAGRPGRAGRAGGVGQGRRVADRRRPAHPARLGRGAGQDAGRLAVRAAARAGRDRAGSGRQHPSLRPAGCWTRA